MSDVKHGGPAYPVTFEGGSNNGESPYFHEGMTLRDWFAGQALAGINSNPSWDGNGWLDRARASYEAADAMLAARQEDAPHD